MAIQYVYEKSGNRHFVVYSTTGGNKTIIDSRTTNQAAQRLVDKLNVAALAAELAPEAKEVIDPGDAGFADRINPSNFNFSPKLAAIVGAIIGHDYGVRDGRGGHLYSISITSDGCVIAGSTASDGGGAFVGSAADLDRNLAAFRDVLTAADRAEFDRRYRSRVLDYRPATQLGRRR